MAQLAERFLEEYVPLHCKPRTQVEYWHAVDRYILPALGSVRVVALTREEVAELHHGLQDKPYQANRTLGVLSKMMNLAEAWGLRPDHSNPCYHVRKCREGKRERFLTAEELARLGKALDEEEPFATAAVAAYRLLLYTGARLSEIQTLKWEHIRGNRIHLPDTKTGAKTIPLNGPALEVLANAERVEGNPYVIMGARKGEHLHHGCPRGRASKGSTEALAAGAEGRRARGRADPRPQIYVRVGGGYGWGEPADGGEDPGPRPGPNDRTLRPPCGRSTAERIGPRSLLTQEGHARLGQQERTDRGL